MCVNPSKIPDYGFVACRNCWQCSETKVDDWVGRNIAESKSCVAAHAVTLTYGHDLTSGDIDHIRAAVLTYSDVQKYLKYLRADGFPVRYFVVGEYGSMKGRAHWHILLYWQEQVPDHVLKENFKQKHWPHGWSYWDDVHSGSARYACKYLLKDPEDSHKQSFGPKVSKNPALGDFYFRWLAEQYVEQGLSPQNLFYSFPDVRRVPQGTRTKTAKAFQEASKPIRFRMHGITATNFLEHFEKRWEEVHGTQPPSSEALWDNGQKRWKKYWELNAPYVDGKRRKGPVPSVPPFEGAKVQFCEKANCYFTDTAGTRLYYSIDLEGDAGWYEKISPKVHDPYNTQRIWRLAGFEKHVPKEPDLNVW